MPVRSAVVGCGIAGEIHADLLDLHPSAELVALCDTDVDRLRAVEIDSPATRYADLERLLEDETLDSVHVCTPVHTHAPIATRTLEEGIATLIEKPAAPSTEAVEEMIDAAKRNETPVSVVHDRKFSPEIQRARRKVRRGEIGDVVSVTMLYSEPLDLYEPTRGDWVFDLPGAEIGEGLVHQVYLPLTFVDGLGDIACVSKQNFAGYDDSIDFDGVAIEMTDSPGTRLITTKVSTNAVPKHALEIHGTDGELVVDFRRYGVFVNRDHPFDPTPATVLLGNLDLAAQLLGNLARNVLTYGNLLRLRRKGEVRGWANTGHYHQVDAYLESLEAGVQPPVPLEDARDTIRVLEAVGSRTGPSVNA
ncbi:Gfo/Idh/MocA family protein [Natronococcus roseus]|uniref:Gfo/Idh/MocA family protein n=1 Tax=Natronococcus roseus TaxID=1052014 RepID=UPI00374D6777